MVMETVMVKMMMASMLAVMLAWTNAATAILMMLPRSCGKYGDGSEMVSDR